MLFYLQRISDTVALLHAEDSSCGSGGDGGGGGGGGGSNFM